MVTKVGQTLLLAAAAPELAIRREIYEPIVDFIRTVRKGIFSTALWWSVENSFLVSRSREIDPPAAPATPSPPWNREEKTVAALPPTCTMKLN